LSGPDTRTELSNRRASRRYSRLITIARLSLIWERLWQCLWQPLAVIALFIGVGLMDFLPHLPLWLHAGTLLGVFVLLCIVSIRSFQSYRSSTEAENIHRVEIESGLSDRPLASLRDKISGNQNDPLAVRLWHEHLLRAANKSEHLSAPLPRPELARHDPMALRIVALLALIIGISMGHEDPGSRLARALLPNLNWQSAPIQADVWVNPPAYTGHTPYHLSIADASNEVHELPNDIPVGSDILVQVGSDSLPRLMLGSRAISFEPIGTGGYRADTQVGASDAAESSSNLVIIVEGREPVEWSVRLIVDTPPVVDFIEEPSEATRGRLKVSFAAKDDYDLRDVNLVIHNLILPDDNSEEAILRLPLPLPRRNTSAISTSVMRDLSEHEWAGIQVAINLEAGDAIGQIGRSGTITMILPERPFNHPVAKKLVQYRKELSTPTDSTVFSVIDGLNELSLRPGSYNNDAIAFLVMRVARSRLTYLANEGDLQSVRRMLWDTALRIEDGEFAMAGRELADAHDQLMEALQDGVYGEMINQLLDALRAALDRFMAALTEQLAQKGLDSVSDLPGMAYMDNTDILNMLEDARELARTGSMEAAQQTLDELRAMLENVEAAMNSDVSMDAYNESREMLEKLFNLTHEQESLLDDTFRQVRRAQDPRNDDIGQPLVDPDEATNPYTSHVERQENLRDRLRDLMPQLQGENNQMPPPVIQAERSMQRSTQSLSGGNGGQSIPNQSDALDALRRTSELLAQQMAQQLSGMPGSMTVPRGLLPNSGTDPFGRMGSGSLGSRMDDGSVQVPTQFDVERAQEIFNELRNRAGDLDRPSVERQYIERLLQPF
jgi:uncharacterized protein (TIGR02302 family)